jgi:membrane protein YdbS with pleckstrin-like domain
MNKTAPTHSSLGKWPRIASPAAGDDAAGVSPNLTASVVPQEMLHGDEVILLLTKPSPLFIFLTSFRFLIVATLLAVVANRAFPSYAPPNTAALGAALLSLARLVWALLVWTSHTYMLTNQRIVTIKGVLNVTVVAAPLRKVQRTTLYRPLWMRFFGLGTIGLATAATEGYDATWVLLSRPIETHETIVAAIRKAQ